MDNLTAEQRSATMARIRSTGSQPERRIVAWLRRRGYRISANVATLPGCPDVVISAFFVAIFVNGCFWHQHFECPRAVLPKSNRRYWLPKLAKNVRNDYRNQRKLRVAGWHVIVVWECQIKRDFGRVVGRIEKFLHSRASKMGNERGQVRAVRQRQGR